MDIVEDLCVLGRGDEGNGESLGSESAGSSDSVEVLVVLVGHVEVDDDVDLLDVDSSSVHVRRYHYAVLGLLEVVVHFDSLFLLHVSVRGDGRETFFSDHVLQLGGVLGVADEDDDLVELEGVEQVDQLLDFLVFLELDVILLETMKGQL